MLPTKWDSLIGTCSGASMCLTIFYRVGTQWGIKAPICDMQFAWSKNTQGFLIWPRRIKDDNPDPGRNLEGANESDRKGIPQPREEQVHTQRWCLHQSFSRTGDASTEGCRKWPRCVRDDMKMRGLKHHGWDSGLCAKGRMAKSSSPGAAWFNFHFRSHFLNSFLYATPASSSSGAYTCKTETRCRFSNCKLMFQRQRHERSLPCYYQQRWLETTDKKRQKRMPFT